MTSPLQSWPVTFLAMSVKEALYMKNQTRAMNVSAFITVSTDSYILFLISCKCQGLFLPFTNFDLWLVESSNMEG